MTYIPTLGQDAMMRVSVVREEYGADGVTGYEYIVECPNGMSTVAMAGHLAPPLSAVEVEAVGRAFRELETQIGELLHLLGGPYAYPVSNEEIAITTAHHRAEEALCEIAPLRERMGWP